MDVARRAKEAGVQRRADRGSPKKPRARQSERGPMSGGKKTAPLPSDRGREGCRDDWRPAGATCGLTSRQRLGDGEDPHGGRREAAPWSRVSPCLGR